MTFGFTSRPRAVVSKLQIDLSIPSQTDSHSLPYILISAGREATTYALDSEVLPWTSIKLSTAFGMLRVDPAGSAWQTLHLIAVWRLMN